ncbi:polymorphic toxin type 46 domain-containing protein [Pseudomonas sp. CJQ_13]|uniref:polymorphic toxin type 46 domain-containing protein n=1 Tax=Pseudomonas sp. CJQ_13 TaxID=3367170 RepID=UPI00370AB792
MERSGVPLRNSKPKIKITIKKDGAHTRSLLERATWQYTNIRGNQDTAANFFKSQGYKSADYIPLLIEPLHDHRKEIARLTIVKGTNGDLSGLQ